MYTFAVCEGGWRKVVNGPTPSVMCDGPLLSYTMDDMKEMFGDESFLTFSAEFFQIGFAGTLGVFAVGFGVGLIISVVRKLRMR